MAACTTSAGMRSWARTSPLEPWTAATNRSAHVFSHTRMAAEQSFGKPVGHLGHVVLADQATDGAFQGVEGLRHLRVEVTQLEPAHLPRLVLGDEEEIEQANDAGFDQLGQRRGHVAVELVAGELDHDVFDGCGHER